MEVRIDTGEAWFDWQKYIIWEFLDQKELVGLKGSPANARKIFERLDGLKSEGKKYLTDPNRKVTFFQKSRSLLPTTKGVEGFFKILVAVNLVVGH